MLAVIAFLCDYHAQISILDCLVQRQNVPIGLLHTTLLAGILSGSKPQVKKLKVDNIPKILSCSKSYKIPCM